MDATKILSTGIKAAFDAIARGTGHDERIGDKIFVKNIFLRFTFLKLDTSDREVRLSIFKSRNPVLFNANMQAGYL